MKIYISLISLNTMLSSRGLALHDVPALASAYGFDGIEILDRQLSALDADALGELGDRCKALECGVIVDAGCDLTRADTCVPEIGHLETVIEQAAGLGCTVVRVAIGGQRFSIQKLIRRSRPPAAKGDHGKRTLMSAAWLRRAGYLYRSRASNFARLDENSVLNAVDALDRVLPIAEKRGIALAIENHWGISSRAEWIVRMLDDVTGTNIGTCPDFGNFPSRADRYAGLEMLAPRALHVQAKCWGFRNDGEERTIDFGRCMRILRDCGYDRTVAVEYEGGGDGMQACIKARELILRSL